MAKISAGCFKTNSTCFKTAYRRSLPTKGNTSWVNSKDWINSLSGGSVSYAANIWLSCLSPRLGSDLASFFLASQRQSTRRKPASTLTCTEAHLGRKGSLATIRSKSKVKWRLSNRKPIALSVIKKLGLANSPDSELSRGLISESLGFLFGGTAKPASSDPATLDKLARVLQRNLAVERISGSRVITISYSADNPEIGSANRQCNRECVYY